MSDTRTLARAFARSERWLRDQGDVLEMIVHGSPLESVAGAIAGAVERHGPGTRCAIHVVDDGRTLRLLAAPSLAAGDAERIRRIPVGDTPLLRTDIADVSRADGRDALAFMARRSGARAFTAVPVIAHDVVEPAGVVVLLRATEGSISPAHAATLDAAVHLVAMALEHERARTVIAHAAIHDALTGLPNRDLLTDRIAQALHHHRSRGQMLAVVVIDLDNFRLVNDSLGHEAGDRVLVDVAARLGASLRPGDTLARFGGDKFAVLCESISGEAHALEIAQRLLRALRTPFLADHHSVMIGASAGASLSSIEGDELRAEDMVRQADSACYRGKERGRGRVELFDAGMWERAVHRLALEGDLRRAIDGGELRLEYQAEVSLQTGEVLGAEALVRWSHPRRGLLPPGEFIPLAEESSLILPLGAWVLERACFDAARWLLAGRDDLVVSVNVSQRQLADRGLVELVQRILDVSGLPPSMLCLEVTENVLLDAAGPARDTLRRLREMGVHLALDDFGTGYASLSALGAVPADTVKIDTSFIAGVDDEGVERVVVAAVIQMATTLGMGVVAEGVEHASQARTLSLLGCPVAQGFLYSRPVDREAFDLLLSGAGVR